MKKGVFIVIVCCVLIFSTHAQNKDSLASKPWSISADANFYLIPDNFIFLPVLRADKNHLHLEARYNYEDFNTFSLWGGYNFYGGKKFEYLITPMLGGVVGSSNGFATGLELDFNFKKFEFWSESEYFYSVDDAVYNFIYNWTDITYAPKDWFWFGISGQRTRLVETELELNRGLLLGAAFKNWEFTGYLYNLGFDEKYFLVTLTYNH